MQPLPWTLEAADVLALPIDDLAMRVLQDASSNNTWNWHNWLIFAKQQVYPNQPDVINVLSEAWAWLLNRGLVVWNPQQSAEASIVVSRQGKEALERGLPWLRAVQRLDIQLVPALEAKARPQFLRGDFEAAAFMAMKEVEVRVRTMTGLSNSLVGTALMQEAFKPPKPNGKERKLDPKSAGPLWQDGSDPGEAVATMEIFKGSIGLFKNPASHRRVDFTDPTEAAEVVLLADLLMRLLDKISP